jgi:hypothetical protein
MSDLKTFPSPGIVPSPGDDFAFGRASSLQRESRLEETQPMNTAVYRTRVPVELISRSPNPSAPAVRRRRPQTAATTSNPPAKSYWRMVHDRAVVEAAAALHLESRKQLAISASVIAVGIAVLVWLLSLDAGKVELIVRVGLAWAVAVWLIPGVYLWKLWGLPPRLHQEQLSKAAALEARIAKKQEQIKIFKQIRDLHKKGQDLLDNGPSADTLTSWSTEVEECLRSARDLSELELFSTIQSSGGLPHTHSMKLAKLRLILGRAAAKVEDA